MEFFRRVGHGSSYCLSVKFGLVKGEYILDHNTGAGTVFFRFGERFEVLIRPLRKAHIVKMGCLMHYWGIYSEAAIHVVSLLDSSGEGTFVLLEY
jgi:hypothetical protein